MAITLVMSAYAWRDWYKALCFLVVLVAVAGYSGVPRGMFNISGISPYNFLLVNIIFAFLIAYRREDLKWDLPTSINILLFAYVILILFSIYRYSPSTFEVTEAYFLGYRGSAAPKTADFFVDYFVNGVKAVLPAVLLYFGCNSRERLLWGISALLVMHLLLAILVINLMPIGLLTDSDALNRRAIHILDQEIGFYSANLSMMFAGCFWVFIALRDYFAPRYSWLLAIGSAIILLAMLLTGGRGGFLAWTIVALVMAFARWRRYLILAPILLLLAVTFVPSFHDRVFGAPDIYSSSSAFASDREADLSLRSSGRTTAWPLVIDKIRDAPFLGYGFDGIVSSGVTLQLINEYDYTFFHPHNSYLQLMIDGGVVGTFPILLLFFIIAISSWSLFKDDRNKLYVLAGGTGVAMVFTFLAASLTGQSFYPTERSVPMWCAIALMSKIAIQRKKIDQKNKFCV